MNTMQLKIWLLAIGGAIVALFLLFFGVKFLSAPNDAEDWQLILLGIGSVLSGVFTIAAQIYIPRKYMAGAILILLGIYFFARATGTIDGAWFMRLLGLASLVGCGVIIYVTYIATGKIR